MRHELVGTWAAAWAAGAIAGVAGLAASGHLGWSRYVLLVLAVCVALGLPNYRGAKAQGSRHPIIEGAIWALAAAALVFVAASYYYPATPLASPADLNINTTETMLRRQQQFDRGGIRPDLILYAFAVLVWAHGTVVASGILGHPAASVRRSIQFSLYTVLGGSVGTATGILAAPILGHLASLGVRGTVEIPAAVAGFAAGAAAAGAVAGAFIEYGRKRCFSES